MPYYKVLDEDQYGRLISPYTDTRPVIYHLDQWNTGHEETGLFVFNNREHALTKGRMHSIAERGPVWVFLVNVQQVIGDLPKVMDWPWHKHTMEETRLYWKAVIANQPIEDVLQERVVKLGMLNSVAVMRVWLDKPVGLFIDNHRKRIDRAHLERIANAP